MVKGLWRKVWKVCQCLLAVVVVCLSVYAACWIVCSLLYMMGTLLVVGLGGGICLAVVVGLFR